MKHLSTIALSICVLIITGCSQPAQYITNEGLVFGTSYRIVYQSNSDLHEELKKAILEVNQSLSTYEKTSVISRINQNDTSVVLDDHFIRVFDKAVEVTQISNGAFDMTVAPLVNAWGFGFTNKDSISTELIDSLLLFTGMEKVSRVGYKVTKTDPRVMLDASAIAKGYGVDVAALCLEKLGVSNYLVEIGGEVRTKGINAKGEAWKIGIDKPIDDREVQQRQLEAIIKISGHSMATSGNYRNYYIEDGRKYAHTINPKTGYPVQSDILSSSVIAADCMTADAYATAFMVLGLDKSMAIVKADTTLQVFFVCTDSLGQLQEVYSPGFEKMIAEIIAKE